MPNVDVTDLLGDPDLASPFSVKRRTETVSGAGRVTLAETLIPGLVGVIYPDKPSNLVVRDDGQMTSRVIKIVTTFRLRVSATGVQPDIVVWQGVDYTVKDLQNYTQFGAGFVEAIAESMNASDPALT